VQTQAVAGFYDELVPLVAPELAKLREADEPALARLVVDEVTAEDSAEHGAHIAVTFRDPEPPD